MECAIVDTGEPDTFEFMGYLIDGEAKKSIESLLDAAQKEAPACARFEVRACRGDIVIKGLQSA